VTSIMKIDRGLPKWVVPALGAGLLAAAGMSRRPAPVVNCEGMGASMPAIRRSTLKALPLQPVGDSVGGRSEPALQDPEANGPEEDEALISAYRAFLSAVRAGDDPACSHLVPILRRQRTSALRLACEQVSRARTRLDRESAQRTVVALREDDE
jgi:hypothetical protein